MTFPHILIVYRKLIFARVLRTLVSGCKVKERAKALVFSSFSLSSQGVTLCYWFAGLSDCFYRAPMIVFEFCYQLYANHEKPLEELLADIPPVGYEFVEDHLRIGYMIGKLYIDGRYFCDTLEDTDRGLTMLGTSAGKKIKKETPIPAGVY